MSGRGGAVDEQRQTGGAGRGALTRREVLGMVGASLLAACFSERPTTGPNGDGEEVVVEMRPDLTFSPETVTIAVGETIVWRNTSAFAHSATADPAKATDPSHVQLPAGASTWDSGLVPAGGDFRRTFDVAGEYRYFCIPHEAQEMLGRITVTP